MGRRNWLFCWTEVGAKYVGIIHSLLATCRLQKVDPYTYLVDVLQRVETHPARDVHLLTPRLWKQHFASTPCDPISIASVNAPLPDRFFAGDSREGQNRRRSSKSRSRERRRSSTAYPPGEVYLLHVRDIALLGCSTLGCPPDQGREAPNGKVNLSFRTGRLTAQNQRNL